MRRNSVGKSRRLGVVALAVVLGSCESGGGSLAELPYLDQTPEAAPAPDPAEPPSFEAVPVPEPLEGVPAPVDFDSHPRAGQFRTVLASAAAEGPNFAGSYTVATWGCGTMCQEFMIIDSRTGEVFDGRTTAVGVDFRIDSALLVVNPPERFAGAPCVESNCATRYLVWNGSRLEPLLEQDERERIRAAAVQYVRARTAITEVTVEIQAVADGWARVRVLPEGGVTDPAVAYLRAVDGGWEGVAIGTGFTPPDLDDLGVPEGVRE